MPSNGTYVQAAADILLSVYCAQPFNRTNLSAICHPLFNWTTVYTRTTTVTSGPFVIVGKCTYLGEVTCVFLEQRVEFHGVR